MGFIAPAGGLPAVRVAARAVPAGGGPGDGGGGMHGHCCGRGTDPFTMLLMTHLAGLCIVIPLLIVALGYFLESRDRG